jgi:phosphoglycerate dehydrogenase-like enzyme
MLDELTAENLLAFAPEADYILASGRLKIDGEILAAAKNLKMIQRTGVGLDSLDMDAISEKKIPLYVNPGINAQSVAEHTLLLILSCLRRLTVINADTKAGKWNKQEQGTRTNELKGKTVGIIGMGNIAQRLADMLAPFGVNILYTNLYKMPDDFESAHRARFVRIDELFGESDIITINCALTSETKGLINSDTIALMKDGAIIVNTARGPIIDAKALSDSLRSGKIAFAGLDVHEKEPLPDDYPLKDIENVILTPHIGGITFESFHGMMRDAMRNIKLFDNGELEAIEPYKYL